MTRMPQGRAVRPVTGTLAAQSGNVSSACTDAPSGAHAVLTIDLPLPPNILRPNKIGGQPPAAVTRARRKARTEACQVAASAWRGRDPWAEMPRWTRVRAVATFSGVSSQMDRPNAEGWLKATVDGIADALMGRQDHGWEWEDVRFVKGAAGVEITIREGTE